jgi:hypothetical protein
VTVLLTDDELSTLKRLADRADLAFGTVAHQLLSRALRRAR